MDEGGDSEPGLPADAAAERGEPAAPAIDDGLLEGLGAALLWRMGRVSDDLPVTVRVGFATAAALFAELPRLRTATDAELEQAVRERSLSVEWVGPRPR